MLYFPSKNIDYITKLKKKKNLILCKQAERTRWYYESTWTEAYIRMSLKAFWKQLSGAHGQLAHDLFCGITGAYSSMGELHCKRNMMILMRVWEVDLGTLLSARPGFLTLITHWFLHLTADQCYLLNRCPSPWRYPKLFCCPNCWYIW